MKKFELLQAIESHGAHACEFFEIEGSLFLFVANFGDRQAKIYDSFSTIWQLGLNSEFTEKQECSSTNNTCHDNYNKFLFHLVGRVSSFGATDGEFFSLGKGRYFLAVSEEGDLGKGADSSFNSRVYALLPSK